MQPPTKTLALLCLGAGTTTSFTFQTCGIHYERAAQSQSRGRSSGELQTRGWSRAGSSASSGSAVSSSYRARRRRSTHVSPAERPSSLLYCAPPTSGEEDNYGSSDYSEYGYEPEYEMQDENSFADEKTLEKWRTERLLVNDRWQFGMYGKQNVGDWVGTWQEYIATDLQGGQDEAVGAMIGIVPGERFVAHTRITRRNLKFAGDTRVFEHEHERTKGNDVLTAPSCPAPVVETLFSDSFRGGNGTQVVGNTYTLGDARSPVAASADSPSLSTSPASSKTRDDMGDIWVEMGLRARRKDVRMRCAFQYSRGMEEACVKRVFLVREGLNRLPVEDGTIERELYGSAGKGLYDPPSQSRSPHYFSIYAEGGLTIRFPLKVEAGQGGVFSVDWTAGDMRYQADRVFDVLDGSCRRLEVTEIGTDDAEIFLPKEKF